MLVMLLITFFAWGSQDLKLDLYKKLARYHTNIGYSQAKKHLFGKLFLEGSQDNYLVIDRYCGKEIFKGVGPMLNPSGVEINCEHSWPKKKFNPRESYKLQESDLHHLFPVDAATNSLRSNFPFAEVTGSPVSSSCQMSKIGKSIGGSVTSFEPPHDQKGDVARAMFYFSIRYRMAIDPIQEGYFRKWNLLDPPDPDEIWRNGEIEKVQGNRNPFIDDTSLANKISDF